MSQPLPVMLNGCIPQGRSIGMIPLDVDDKEQDLGHEDRHLILCTPRDHATVNLCNSFATSTKSVFNEQVELYPQLRPLHLGGCAKGSDHERNRTILSASQTILRAISSAQQTVWNAQWVFGISASDFSSPRPPFIVLYCDESHVWMEQSLQSPRRALARGWGAHGGIVAMGKRLNGGEKIRL